MRGASLLAIIAACLGVASADAQAPVADSSGCPTDPLVTPMRYERLHQIPTTPAEDDITHKIVTPGGMVLDTPKLVAATDVLTIVSRDEAVVCFSLLTFARERRKCELGGVARNEMADTFLFRQDDVVVRFTFLGSDQVRVEPVGTGYRRQCESSGEIQPAIYTRKTGAG